MKDILYLPAEVRLMIYSFVLIHDGSIPFTQFSTLDCSLLRTCRTFRREGIALFFERNCFMLPTTTSKEISHLCRRFKRHKALIRCVSLDLHLEGQGYVDLIWNLMMVQQELGPIFEVVLVNFTFLRSLYFQFTTTGSCLQRQTEMEEVFCASIQACCTELIEKIQQQCREFGTVETRSLDNESFVMIVSPSYPKVSNF